jgi:hypothetical protein
MQPGDEIPRILRHIVDEANRPRSQRETDAYRAWMLGGGLLENILEAIHETRQIAE